jgi:hypothetical protein
VFTDCGTRVGRIYMLKPFTIILPFLASLIPKLLLSPVDFET